VTADGVAVVLAGREILTSGTRKEIAKTLSLSERKNGFRSNRTANENLFRPERKTVFSVQNGQRKPFAFREKFFCPKRPTKTFSVPREIFLSKTANENLFRPERKMVLSKTANENLFRPEKNGFVQNSQRKTFPSREKMVLSKTANENLLRSEREMVLSKTTNENLLRSEREMGFAQDAREFFFPSLPREKCFVHNVGQQNSFWKKKRTTSEPGHRPSKPVVYLLFLGRFGQDEKDEGKSNRVVKMATNGTKASVDRKAHVQCRNGDRTKDLKREKKEQKATNASIECGPLLQDGR